MQDFLEGSVSGRRKDTSPKGEYPSTCQIQILHESRAWFLFYQTFMCRQCFAIDKNIIHTIMAEKILYNSNKIVPSM